MKVKSRIQRLAYGEHQFASPRPIPYQNQLQFWASTLSKEGHRISHACSGVSQQSEALDRVEARPRRGSAAAKIVGTVLGTLRRMRDRRVDAICHVIVFRGPRHADGDPPRGARFVRQRVVRVSEGRSIRANVGVEFIGVSWS